MPTSARDFISALQDDVGIVPYSITAPIAGLMKFIIVLPGLISRAVPSALVYTVSALRDAFDQVISSAGGSAGLQPVKSKTNTNKNANSLNLRINPLFSSEILFKSVVAEKPTAFNAKTFLSSLDGKCFSW